MGRNYRRVGAVLVLVLSLLLAGIVVAVFYNSRNLADSRRIASLAATLDAYCQVLQTQKMVYLGFYDSLPPYRKTLQNLTALSQALHPLAQATLKLSSFALGEYRPFGRLEELGEKIQGSIEGISESLQATDNALGNFDEQAHAEVLQAIDRTTGELQDLAQLLRAQATATERSAWLLLAGGLLVSCLFAVLGCALLLEPPAQAAAAQPN
ncbi:MAG: hypothetical protein GX564_10000 [Oligosphaeraceae bacterium]|nr:hypothetical protein [Oligosphaeraceae bacterium]